MARPSSALAHCLVVGGGVLLFAGLCASARGQADLIGSRGGLTTPTVPTTPVLPPTLNLPPDATSSLLNGLNSSGTALRPGMGWLVSDLSHQGFQGPQLADMIHQLKPYKQRGVLTFPQPTQQPVNAPIFRSIQQRIPPQWRWFDNDDQRRWRRSDNDDQGNGRRFDNDDQRNGRRFDNDDDRKGPSGSGHGQGNPKGGKGGKGGKGK